MSEDSSSGDDGFHPSVATNTFDGKLKQKCWECGESFQCMRRLMTHYQSHDVQATCHICQVTFRRMTSLSTHLTNAHSDTPYCEPCNLWFDNKWEFNKHGFNRHRGTHAIAPPSIVKKKTKDLPSNECYKHVTEDHAYGYGLENVSTVKRLTTKPGGDTMSDSRPLVSVETQQERPDPDVEYGNYTLRALEVGDVEMEIPYETESEDTDDSENYRDNETAGGDRRHSVAPGNQEAGYVEKQNEEDSDNSSDEDSNYSPDDKALDSGSEASSSGTSSSSSSSDEHSGNTPTSMCADCGKGPFRNVKIHLLHCTGKRPNFQCSACKRNFADEKSMQEHRAMHRLYACGICNQVFTHWRSYVAHHCLKQNVSIPSTIIYSCAPSIPNKCNLCKAFFPTEQDMLKHIVTDHSKHVSIVNKPSTSTVKHAPPNKAVSTTEAQLVPTSPGLASESSRTVGQLLGPVSHITARKPFVGQSTAGSLPPLMLSSSQPGSVPVGPSTGGTANYIIFKQPPTTVTQVAPQTSLQTQQVTLQSETKTQPPMLSSQMMSNLVQFVVQKQSHFKPVPSVPGKPSAPVLLAVAAPTSSQVTYRAPGPLSTPVSSPDGATSSGAVSVASKPSSPPTLTIVSMFKNDSRELALKERMNTSWRHKATYPCRQCGAVSRQPSLNVSHRYLHRGRRSHRCHCGRAFLHRLHLLRHCVQHAESSSYVCVNCGETFDGAKLLAEHMKGITRRSMFSRIIRKNRTREGCKASLSCDCGQIFVRPSAYIWHQLKNTPKAKRYQKPSK